MSLPNFTFRFYKANAERRLTHAAEWPAACHGLCAWVELDPNPKPEPTQAQLDAPHGASDLWGEPQLKVMARQDMEHFRDHWLLYWNWAPEKEDSPIDLDCAAESLSPFRGNGTRAFLLDLLQYPRVLMPDGFVQIGGAQYVGIPEPTPGVSYIKTTVPCEKGFRGAFDDATARYSDYVKWLGRRCKCSGAAAKALDRFEHVLGWLQHMSSISPSAFDDLEERYTQLEAALLDLSVKVGDFCEPSATARGVTVAADPQVVESLAELKSGVGRINKDIDERRAKNRQQGAINRNGNKDNADHPSPKERTQAANDLDTALKRIHERVMTKGEKVLAACRYVCLHFTPIPGRKDELGRVQHKPLVNLYGKEVNTETQFKTIARYYRARYNAKRRKK